MGVPSTTGRQPTQNDTTPETGKTIDFNKKMIDFNKKMTDFNKKMIDLNKKKYRFLIKITKKIDGFDSRGVWERAARSGRD